MMRSAVVVNKISTCHAGNLQDQRLAKKMCSVMLSTVEDLNNCRVVEEGGNVGLDKEKNAKSKWQVNHRHYQHGRLGTAPRPRTP